MNNYIVVQTPEFRRKLADLGPSESISEVLDVVFGALAEGPYSFRPTEIVDDAGRISGIRSVRTQIYFGETEIAPPLVIFFEILEDSKQVRLMDISQRAGFGLGHADF